MNIYMIYIISTICVRGRHYDFEQTSYETLTDEEYEEFQNQPIKKLCLGAVFGKHSDVVVKLGREWTIEEANLDDDDEDKYDWDSPCHDHVKQSISEHWRGMYNDND